MKVPPQFDLPCGSDDGGDAAGVHLQQGHPGRGVRGEERGAGGPGSLHAPAGETQLEALGVVREETLAQRQADAAAGKHTGGTRSELKDETSGLSISGESDRIKTVASEPVGSFRGHNLYYSQFLITLIVLC